MRRMLNNLGLMTPPSDWTHPELITSLRNVILWCTA
jgi:hypothetical protein